MLYKFMYITNNYLLLRDCKVTVVQKSLVYKGITDVEHASCDHEHNWHHYIQGAHVISGGKNFFSTLASDNFCKEINNGTTIPL